MRIDNHRRKNKPDLKKANGREFNQQVVTTERLIKDLRP